MIANDGKKQSNNDTFTRDYTSISMMHSEENKKRVRIHVPVEVDDREKIKEKDSEVGVIDVTDNAIIEEFNLKSILYACCVYICGLIIFIVIVTVIMAIFYFPYVRTMVTLEKFLMLTNDMGNLTLNQRIFYEHNGYLLIRKLVSSDVLDKCSRRFDDYASGKIERGQITMMRDVSDRKAVNKIQYINHDVVFCEYIENEAILDIVQQFTGPNIMAMHSMLIAKPPDSGSNSSRHPPHQDLYYFPFRPADRIVAAWTAIEPSNKTNGCLFVFPGSHSPRKLYEHNYPKDPTGVNKLYHGIHDLPEGMTCIDLEMEPGDTVFFHPHLIHGSGVNKSARTRKAISCHYAAAECNYIEVRGTIQEPIRNEIMDVIERWYPGVEIEYDQVWSMKSTLVRGIRSSL